MSYRKPTQAEIRAPVKACQQTLDLVQISWPLLKAVLIAKNKDLECFLEPHLFYPIKFCNYHCLLLFYIKTANSGWMRPSHFSDSVK